MYFKWKLFAFQLNIIFMFMIIIQVFKMDIICVLIKYNFHAYDRNSCISKILYLYFN